MRGVPRIQVDVPEDLLREAQSRGLKLDDIVEAAVRKAVDEAIEDEEREAAIAAFIAETEDLVLTEEEEAWAQALVERVLAHRSKHKRAS